MGWTVANEGELLLIGMDSAHAGGLLLIGMDYVVHKDGL